MNKKSTIPSNSDKKTKQADQPLESNTSDLQQVIDEMTNGFALHEIICDEGGKPIDYRFLKMNAAFEKLTGLVATDIVGRRVLEVLPETEPSLIKTYGRVALTGQPERFENYSQPLGKTFSVVAFCPQRGQFAVLFEDITERKQTEKQLLERKQFIESLINLSPDIIYIYDIIERKNVYTNDGIANLLGYSFDEIQQMGERLLPTLMHPEDFKIYLEETYPRYFKIKDGEKVLSQYRMKHKNGDWFWFDCSEIIYLRDPDGAPRQIFGVVHDITARKAAEEKIKAGEELQRNIIQNSPDTIYSFDLDARKTIFLNKDEFFGYSTEELTSGGSILTSVLTEDKDAVQQNWNELVTGKGIQPIEYRFRSKSGETVWIRQRITIMARHTDGSPAQILVTLTDVTARKRITEKLLESERRFRQTLENVKLIAIELDISGNISFCNDYFLQLTGWQPDEIIGKNWFSTFLPDRITEEIGQVFNKALASGDIPSYHENEILTRHGTERQISWSNTVQRDPAGNSIGISSIGEDITDRKQAEQRIAASEAELRALFAGMTDVVIKYDGEGHYLEIAPTRPENLFRPSDEMLGKTVHDILPKEQANYILARIKESLQTGQVVTGEYSLTIDSRQIWFSVNVSPLPDNTVLWMAHDITAHKQAADTLLEAERRFRRTLENVNLIAIEFDNAGCITFCNDHFLQLTGWQREEIIGKNWFNTCLPHSLGKQVEQIFINSLPSGNIPVHYENEIITRQGKERLVSWSNTILRDPAGTPIGISSIGEDITERKQAEEKLNESEQRFRALIEHSHDAVTMLDADGTVLYDSPSIQQVLGYSCTDRIGKKVFEYVVPEERQGMAQGFAKFAQEIGAVVISELHFIHKDGSTRIIEGVRTNLLQEPAVGAVVVNYRDITDRKMAEEAVKTERNFAQQIMSSMGQGLTVTDKQGCFEYINPAYARMTGYDPKDLLGRSPGDFIAQGSIGVLNDAILRRNMGETSTYEVDLVHNDGHIVPVMITGVPRWEAGKVIGTIAVITDLTERKLAEKALRESERRYRERAAELETIMDIAPVALWVAQDPSCNTVVGNRTANELHRIQPDQNASLTPATDPQLRPSHIKIFHDGAEIKPEELPLQVCASKGLEIRDFESQIVFDDGTIIHEIGNAKPLFDENGQPRGAIGAFTNVTGLKQVEEEIRQRVEELDILQKTVLDITAAQNLPGLLESIVERACQLLGAPGGGLYLNDPQKVEAHCVVSYNTPSNYVGTVLKHGEGLAGKVTQSGQTINITNYQNWPGRSPAFDHEQPFSAILGVPLMWGGQVKGVIDLLHYEAGQSFSQANEELATLFAGHAAIAIENSRLLEASQAGEEQVRTLSTRLAEAEENERRRIARELHDQVGQSLSALSINMNIMHSQIPEYLPGFKRRLDDSLMLIDQTTDHIRNLMSELRPAVLDDYGLKAALDWATGSVASRTNLKLLVDGECNRFPPRVEISLFRIAQEALGNITRHAHARNVKILLTQDGPDMSMSVTDDGVGFDPSSVAATEKSGWGLRLMAERAESIGASLQVESTPGHGTTITVRYHDKDSAGG